MALGQTVSSHRGRLLSSTASHECTACGYLRSELSPSTVVYTLSTVSVLVVAVLLNRVAHVAGDCDTSL